MHLQPYLMDKGPGDAGLGAKVGWFFAAPSKSTPTALPSVFLAYPPGFLLFLFGLFIIPELKGRSLEETDELFAAGLHAWQFSKHQTQGTGAKIAALQNEDHEEVRRLSVTQQGGGEEKRFEEKEDADGESGEEKV